MIQNVSYHTEISLFIYLVFPLCLSQLHATNKGTNKDKGTTFLPECFSAFAKQMTGFQILSKDFMITVCFIVMMAVSKMTKNSHKCLEF